MPKKQFLLCCYKKRNSIAITLTLSRRHLVVQGNPLLLTSTVRFLLRCDTSVTDVDICFRPAKGARVHPRTVGDALSHNIPEECADAALDV